jgi:hypothetical protein
VAEGLSKKDKVDKRFDVANEIFSVVWLQRLTLNKTW